MTNEEERQLIDRILAGQRDDFVWLVEKYQVQLFRLVVNILPRAMVEDVVQEAFVAAFAGLRRYDPQRASFRTWLYRIARNLALNAWKKRRETSLADNWDMAGHNNPADALLQKELFSQLDRALDNLAFQEKVIFVLAELEGLPYAEIGRIEGLPLGTVKSKLARIRMKLRRILEDYRS